MSIKNIPTIPKVGKKTELLFLIGLLISFASVAYVLSMIDFSIVSDIDSRVDFGFLVAGFVAIILGYMAHTLRWALFFPKSTNSLMLLKVTILGYLANSILPGKTGEFVRSYIASKLFTKSISSTLLSCFIERTFDVFLAFILFLVSAHLLELDTLIYAQIKSHQTTFLLLASLMLIGPITLYQKSPYLKDKVRLAFKYLRQSLCVTKVLKFLLFSCFFWSMGILSFYLFLNTVDIHPKLQTFIFAAFLNTSMAFVLILPSAPGNIGSFNLCFIFVTSLFLKHNGIDINSYINNQIIYASVVVHILLLLPDIILGLISQLNLKKELTRTL